MKHLLTVLIAIMPVMAMAQIKDINNDSHRGSGSSGDNDKQNAVYKPKKMPSLVRHNYGYFGLTTGLAMGGNNAPFRSEIGFAWGHGYLLAHRKLLLDLTFSTDFLIVGNNDWFSRAFNTTNFNGTKFGFSADIQLAPMYMIINHKPVAWAIGPEVGLRYIFTMGLASSDGTSISQGGNYIAPCYGVRTNVYLGHNPMLFAEYTMIPTHMIQTSNDGYLSTFTNPAITADHSFFKVGVALKLEHY